MNNSAIGVFDSGVGGLTGVDELKKLMPCENIVYLGDTARIPYGTKSRDTIYSYAKQDIAFLEQHDVKMILVACGTVSSVMMSSPVFEDSRTQLRSGVVVPAAHAACAATRNKRIGVIGTSATIKSGSYGKVIHEIMPDVKVIGMACPMFVPLVENGYTAKDCEPARYFACEYLEIMKKEQVDTLILGCTHYPLLRKSLARVIGRGVSLVDSAEVTAESVEEYLTGKNLKNPSGVPGETHSMATDNAQRFARTGGIFLGRELSEGDVELVDIPSSISACSAR